MSTPATFLTACELSVIRAAAEASLDTPVTVAHEAVVGGVYGEQVPTPAVYATCNARFRQPDAPTLANYADKVAHLQVWLVALPISVLPDEGDTITITSDGSVYTVHAILQPQSYSTLNRVLAGKV